MPVYADFRKRTSYSYNTKPLHSTIYSRILDNNIVYPPQTGSGDKEVLSSAAALL
jgi:hypothetical protein